MLLIYTLHLILFVQIALGDNTNITRVSSRDAPKEGPSGKKVLSLEFYKKAHSYLIKTQIHKDFTLQDSIDHVDGAVNWKAPRELEKKFPYYLSGYDWEGQPVWVGEIGKYNLKEQIEKGPEATKNVTKYLYQAFFNILESMYDQDTPEREIRGAFFVGDLEGLDITQASHIPTVQYVLHQLLKYGEILGPWVGHAVGINVSYLATVVFQSVRPFLGGVLERIEIFGTDKAKWKVALHKLLPPEAIPSWYGGSKEYKPVQVFG